MRTNVFDRTWEIKLRPINSLAGLFVVGNDTNANRPCSFNLGFFRFSGAGPSEKGWEILRLAMEEVNKTTCARDLRWALAGNSERTRFLNHQPKLINRFLFTEA